LISSKKLIFLINNPQHFIIFNNHKNLWVKEPREKDQSRRLKRKPTLFSKKDQEISDSVTTFNPEEI
jgi:hypothetical protein